MATKQQQLTKKCEALLEEFNKDLQTEIREGGEDLVDIEDLLDELNTDLESGIIPCHTANCNSMEDVRNRDLALEFLRRCLAIQDTTTQIACLMGFAEDELVVLCEERFGRLKSSKRNWLSKQIDAFIDTLVEGLDWITVAEPEKDSSQPQA